MIKAVIFDLGGVYFEDGTKLAIKKISEQHDIPPNEVKAVLSNSSELGGDYRRGLITEDEFWNGAIKTWDIVANKEDLSISWLDCYTMIEGTEEIIKELKRKNIKLCILSDNVKERVDYLHKRYNFLEYFDDAVLSYEVHKVKPDGEDIFKEAIKRTGLDEKEIVYVDDVEKYIVEGNKLGINTILFKNPAQLKKELQSFWL